MQVDAAPASGSCWSHRPVIGMRCVYVYANVYAYMCGVCTGVGRRVSAEVWRLLDCAPPKIYNALGSPRQRLACLVLAGAPGLCSGTCIVQFKQAALQHHLPFNQHLAVWGCASKAQH